MLVSLLVVNRNGGKHLKRCLDRLAAQTYVNFEAVVLDNASTDGSAETPLPDPRFRLLRLALDSGRAAGANRAALETKGTWLAFAAPGVEAEPEWLMSLMNAARRHPQAAVFGSALLNGGDPSVAENCGYGYGFAGFAWRGGRDWPVEALPDEGEVFAPCGMGMMIRADAFRAAGGFDERFFDRGEDIDLAFRLRLAGHKPVQVTDALLHYEEPATGDAGSRAAFFETRSRVWTFVKNMPEPLFWPLLPFHILGHVLSLINDPRRAFARWDGLVSAIRELPDIWQSRRLLQGARMIPAAAVARALGWSLRKVFWHMADVRPLP